MKMWLIGSMAVLMCFATLSVVEGVTCPNEGPDPNIGECNTQRGSSANCKSVTYCVGSGACSSRTSRVGYYGSWVCEYVNDTYTCEGTLADCYKTYACMDDGFGSCMTDFGTSCIGQKQETSTADAPWCGCG